MLIELEDIYNVMKNYVADGDLDEVAKEVTEHMVDMGYDLSSIDLMFKDHEEVCDAVEDIKNGDDEDAQEDYIDEDNYDIADYAEGTAYYGME
jgi:hypothetical protein